MENLNFGQNLQKIWISVKILKNVFRSNFRNISISVLNLENHDLRQNFRKISISTKNLEWKYWFWCTISKNNDLHQNVEIFITVKIFENIEKFRKSRFR